MKCIQIFLLTIILLKIAWEDARTRHIRGRWILLYGVLGIWNEWMEKGIDLGESAAGFLSVSSVLVLVNLLRPGSFGGGDIKLTAVAGTVLGWERNFAAFAMAMWLSGIFCAVMLAARRMTRKSTIPLGPFLCAGILGETMSGLLTSGASTMG